MKMTPAPRNDMEQIKAQVVRKPYRNDAGTLVSVGMRNDQHPNFDAKAFSSSRQAMVDLMALEPGDAVSLYGSFQPNKLRPQFLMFVVSEVRTPESNADLKDRLSAYLGTAQSSSSYPQSFGPEHQMCPSCKGSGYLLKITYREDEEF